MLVPFAECLTLVITIPETTIEDSCQSFVPCILLFLCKSTIQYRSYRLLIALYYSIDVFRTTGTTFYLEDTHTGIHHTVDEADSLQVLRTHHILIVDFQLVTRFIIRNRIAATANLYTLTTVGRAVGISQTHITLAGNCHAERTMTEHLNTNLLAHRTTDILLLYLFVDMLHLIHIQFTSQHRNISKAGIELQRFRIGNIQLGRKMNLLAHFITIAHHSHITCDDSRDASLLSSIDNLLHRGNIIIIDNGIDGEISLDTMLIAGSSDLTQVIDGKMIGRM